VLDLRLKSVRAQRVSAKQNGQPSRIFSTPLVMGPIVRGCRVPNPHKHCVLSQVCVRASCSLPVCATPLAQLVVYVTHGSEVPQRTLDQVRAMVWGTPGFADAFAFSSWGQTTIAQEDVDFYTMESSSSTVGWISLTQTRNAVASQANYQTRVGMGTSVGGRSFDHVIIIQPGTAPRRTQCTHLAHRTCPTAIVHSSHTSMCTVCG
jgi:hypothetical protein